MEYNKRTHELLFKKLFPFTQLIFSWNVYRPEKGLSFCTVPNAHTKNGISGIICLINADIQNLTFSRGTFSVYHYARLELEKIIKLMRLR